MTTDPDVAAQVARRLTALRAMARELRAWTAALPLWNPMDPGTREGFALARQSAEQGLMARLRSLPGCSLGLSSNGVWADLELAGVRVRSDAGLQGVCAAWTSKVDGLRLQRGRTSPS